MTIGDLRVAYLMPVRHTSAITPCRSWLASEKRPATTAILNVNAHVIVDDHRLQAGSKICYPERDAPQCTVG